MNKILHRFHNESANKCEVKLSKCGNYLFSGRRNLLLLSPLKLSSKTKLCFKFPKMVVLKFGTYGQISS